MTLELASDEAVPAAVDAMLLEILLRNLIDNAVRHGGAPGPVTVQCLRKDGAAVLAVADAGPGVDEDELARLGQRFYRASGARGPGSGLGLSIVQRIADDCAARVAYRRNPGGRGFVAEVQFKAPGPG